MKQIFFPVNLTITFAITGLSFGAILRLISLQYTMAEPRCSTLPELNRHRFIKEVHEAYFRKYLVDHSRSLTDDTFPSITQSILETINRNNNNIIWNIETFPSTTQPILETINNNRPNIIWNNCEFIARSCYEPRILMQINGVWDLPPLDPRTVQVEEITRLHLPGSAADRRNNAYSTFLRTVNFVAFENTRQTPVLPNTVLDDPNTFYYFLYNLRVVKCYYSSNNTTFFYTTFRTSSVPLFVFERIEWETIDSVKIDKVLYMEHQLRP